MLLSLQSFNRVTFYTDGSCSGNPGPGAYAWIMLRRKEIQSSYVSEVFDLTTSNRMELLGAISAILYALRSGYQDVTLVTDSQYLSKGFSEWMSGWRRLNFPYRLKNRGSWMTLSALNEMLKIQINWVRGHSNDRFNDYVHNLCFNRVQYDLS